MLFTPRHAHCPVSRLASATEDGAPAYSTFERATWAVSCLAWAYSFLCSVLIVFGVVATWQSLDPLLFGCTNKVGSLPEVGSLPSSRVMLCVELKRYYEPLRLPSAATAISLPYTQQSVASPPRRRVSSTGQQIFENMPSLLPRESMSATSVMPAPFQRPSPSVHRVGFSTYFTRLHIGSLALRPALLLFGNSRPRVATAPLPHATGAYGQLPGRDFNPLDLLLLLRTDSLYFTIMPLFFEPDQLSRVRACNTKASPLSNRTRYNKH